MEEENAAKAARLEEAEVQLSQLKNFFLSSATLRSATFAASNGLGLGGAETHRKKKASRRATCDAGAISSDLGFFRGSSATIEETEEDYDCSLASSSFARMSTEVGAAAGAASDRLSIDWRSRQSIQQSASSRVSQVTDERKCV